MRILNRCEIVPVPWSKERIKMLLLSFGIMQGEINKAPHHIDDHVALVLLHVANNQKAFDLIKVGWALTPEGSLQVRQSDDPNQEFLIESEADLRPLVRILWDQFAGQTVPLSAVYDVVDRSIYKRAHANELLRAWRKSGACDFTGFAGTFAFKKNPTIEFRTRPK